MKKINNIEKHKFKEQIMSFLPFKREDISINKINVDKLMHIRKYTLNENQKITTCRPIQIKSDDEARKFFELLLNNENCFVFGIYLFDKEIKKHKLIGKISMFDYNIRNRSCEIGYYCLPEYRGKKYMKKALYAVCKLVFERTSLNKLYAQTGSFNKASIKLLKSLNFSLDGILREHHELNGDLFDDHLYSLTFNDWNDKIVVL